MEKKSFLKKHMLCLLFALCIFHIYAADDGKITVRGIVTDINENSLIGVTVKLENSSIGTTSDLDGKFVLDNVPSGSYLVFSYVGMESLRLKASSELMKVVMKENAVALSEVVAVGYATMHKEDLTSAISKVDEKMFNNGVTNSPINLLTGKVSGLVVRNVSGSDPNATPEIQLRGVGSIRAGSTPLIIIDGVYSTMTDLNSLNTTDIKSFNVLKDASSAAIYGTRGSNGVIIVETKDAEQGKTSIEYSSYYFTETPAKKLEVMDADEYLGFLKEKGLSVVNNDYGFSTDWTDELIRNNFGTYQGLSLATNNKNSDLRVSLGYKNNQGMVINTGNEQLNARINFKQKFFNEKFVVNGFLSGSNTKTDYTDYGAFMQAIVYHPTAPVYDSEGNFFEYAGVGPYNPVALLSQTENRGETTLYTGGITATIEIIKDLNVNASFSTINENYEGSKYVDRDARDCVLNNYEGLASMEQHFYRKNMMEIYANYNRTIAEHRLGGMLGYSYNEEKRTWSNASNRGFLTDALGANNIGNGTWLGDGKATMGRGQDESKLIAFFGRLNYSYKNRYLLNASVRREGSTRFGDNNKWGWFPAVSVGWRLTEENFMENIQNINNLKLRMGFGITGNQDIPLYTSISKFNDRGYVYNGGIWMKAYGPTTNPNPDLKWEKNTEYNIGIDLGICDDRFTMSLDYYYRKTTDLLDWYDAQIPSSIYSTIFTNVGSLSNSGIEVALGYDLISSKKFNWHIDGCFSYNENKLISLSNDSYKANHITYNQLVSPANGQTTYIFEAGKPIGTYYGYKYKGFDESGKWVFEDYKKDGQYTTDDFQYLGSGLPKYNFSISSRMDFYNFDLSFTMRGAAGFKVLNTKRIYYENPVSLPFNLLRSTLDSPLNDAAVFSDYYLENGNYLKMDNLTFGYNLKFDNVKWLSNIRLYVTATNLFTITGYTGVNPEVGSGLTPGFDGTGYYPSARSFIFGLNLKF